MNWISVTNNNVARRLHSRLTNRTLIPIQCSTAKRKSKQTAGIGHSARSVRGKVPVIGRTKDYFDSSIAITGVETWKVGNQISVRRQHKRTRAAKTRILGCTVDVAIGSSSCPGKDTRGPRVSKCPFQRTVRINGIYKRFDAK